MWFYFQGLYLGYFLFWCWNNLHMLLFLSYLWFFLFLAPRFLCYVYIPSRNLSFQPIPPIVLPSPLQPFYFSYCSPPYSDSQLSWSKIIQFTYLLASFLQLPLSHTLVYLFVSQDLDPSINDPISSTNMFSILNSNGCPFANLGLLIGSCSSNGLNIVKEGCVSTLYVYNLVACIPFCVYCCCCCCK